MVQQPTNWDDPHPQKLASNSYEPAFLLGTVPVAGSVSSIFDLSSWTNFALQINPNGGTILGGTVITIRAAQSLQDSFNGVYGTTGAVASTLQCGSTGIQVISPIPVLAPLRFVEFVLGGTQDAARTLTLFVK